LTTATRPTLLETHRNAVIVGGVVLFHAFALWALNSGLLRRAAEMVVPTVVMAEILGPAPRAEPAPPQPKPKTPEPPKPAQPAVRQPAAPAPQPVPAAAPSPNAPTVQAAPAAPAPTAAPAGPAVAAAPAPARVDLPSSDADYLNNPKPPYPPVSRRLGEQGKVVVRVFIGTDGSPQKAEIRQSSGFDRLDQVALATVLKWRYVPGKRGGVPEAMWFNVPINFVLE
jgi:protein TonB